MSHVEYDNGKRSLRAYITMYFQTDYNPSNCNLHYFTISDALYKYILDVCVVFLHFITQFMHLLCTLHPMLHCIYLHIDIMVCVC